MATEDTHQDIPSICRERMRSVLRVTVIRGRKLYQTDLFSQIDPFVKVKLGEDMSTSICQREAGRDVDFDWSVSFPFVPTTAMATHSDDSSSSAPLELIVMDSNTLRPDEIVGRHVVTREQLNQYHGEAGAFQGEVALTRNGILHGEKPAGFLEVRIYWEEQSMDQAFPVPTLHCISNHNLAGGIVQEILDGGKFEIFRTWQMNLWMVGAVFQGEMCGWNQEYKAAQMIYGKSPSALIIRKMIKAQHAMLYSKDRGVGSYKEYEVHGLLDFFQMLSGVCSSKSIGENAFSSLSSVSDTTTSGRRYTYVVLPDSTMHFSRTGKATAQDFLSKHALHACAKKAVVYAGEFFFDTKVHPQPTLIIDNNSGTFSPSKDKLPRLQALLEINLGKDLPILALDREDPDLKMYSEANEIQ